MTKKCKTCFYYHQDPLINQGACFRWTILDSMGQFGYLTVEPKNKACDEYEEPDDYDYYDESP